MAFAMFAGCGHTDQLSKESPSSNFLLLSLLSLYSHPSIHSPTHSLIHSTSMDESLLWALSSKPRPLKTWVTIHASIHLLQCMDAPSSEPMGCSLEADMSKLKRQKCRQSFLSSWDLLPTLEWVRHMRRTHWVLVRYKAPLKWWKSAQINVSIHNKLLKMICYASWHSFSSEEGKTKRWGNWAPKGQLLDSLLLLYFVVYCWYNTE